MSPLSYMVFVATSDAFWRVTIVTHCICETISLICWTCCVSGAIATDTWCESSSIFDWIVSLVCPIAPCSIATLTHKWHLAYHMVYTKVLEKWNVWAMVYCWMQPLMASLALKATFAFLSATQGSPNEVSLHSPCSRCFPSLGHRQCLTSFWCDTMNWTLGCIWTSKYEVLTIVAHCFNLTLPFPIPHGTTCSQHQQTTPLSLYFKFWVVTRYQTLLRWSWLKIFLNYCHRFLKLLSPCVLSACLLTRWSLAPKPNCGSVLESALAGTEGSRVIRSKCGCHNKGWLVTWFTSMFEG